MGRFIFFIEITRSRYREMYKKTISEWLNQRFTILAVKDGNELCGLVNGMVRRLGDDEVKKPLVFKEDYGESR